MKKLVITKNFWPAIMRKYRVYKKTTEQIWNRSQRREAAQSMKFFFNIACLGTYDVE